ncbi:MAG: hypothetical protein FWG02_11635, partial [Holophagaceae bacterium]|nr:hypothetical protein [Holophagaceae bacterium]
LHTLAFPRGAVLKDVDGNSFRDFTFAKWQDDEWHYLGSYKTPHANLLAQAIPCDNDRFIFISHNADIAGNTGLQRTPFSRLTLNPEKHEIRVSASIDHGQDEMREHMLKDNIFALAFQSNIIITDNYATLLNFKTGLYWIFSLESASLKKAGNIFKKVMPEMIVKGGFTDAILCAHPQKDGTILISTQLEEIFITKPDYAEEMRELGEANKIGRPGATMDTRDWLDLYLKREYEAKEESPFIAWYCIHPENGKVEKIAPPDGAAMDRMGGTNDRWRPLPGGSVRMGVVQLKQPETVSQEPQKDEVLVK